MNVDLLIFSHYILGQIFCLYYLGLGGSIYNSYFHRLRYMGRACSNCVPIFITFVPALDLGRPKLSHKWLHCHNPEPSRQIAFGPPSGPANLKCFAFPFVSHFPLFSSFFLLRLKVHSIKIFSRDEKTPFFPRIIFYSTRKF